MESPFFFIDVLKGLFKRSLSREKQKNYRITRLQVASGPIFTGPKKFLNGQKLARIFVFRLYGTHKTVLVFERQTILLCVKELHGSMQTGCTGKETSFCSDLCSQGLICSLTLVGQHVRYTWGTKAPLNSRAAQLKETTCSLQSGALRYQCGYRN